jgi:hypothetical protein
MVSKQAKMVNEAYIQPTAKNVSPPPPHALSSHGSAP